MPARRSPRKQAQQPQNPPEVIEILSSDFEAEAPEDEVADEIEDEAPESTTDTVDINDQPLLRAAGIKYKTDQPEDEEPPQDEPGSPPSAKLAVRTKDTGSVKHRHVSIEIPLPTSSALRRRAGDSTSGSQQGNDEEDFKTPKERRHITFDDSDHDEFVTPREGPSGNPLESSVPKPVAKDEEEEEEDEEESDDDAPPEAVSTRTAEAETAKAAEAAAKAAERQAAAAKRKRQERDAFLRRQAEERKQSQKGAAQDREDEDEATPSTQEPASASEKRKREVPKLLPLELLESDDEDDAPQQNNSAADSKNKRRKLGGAEQALLREPKPPKDKRVGSTAYRVVKPTGDARLAPKVKKQAVNLKETLLRRDRMPVRKGGFFVKSR